MPVDDVDVEGCAGGQAELIPEGLRHDYPACAIY